MAVRPIDAIELQKRMCALCNQDYADEPCEPSDCTFIRALNETPTLTQPNEPLTLEKLENMEDTTPVWWDQINSWVLVYKGNLTTWSGKHLYAKGSNGKFYRRPPEEVLRDGKSD